METGTALGTFDESAAPTGLLINGRAVRTLRPKTEGGRPNAEEPRCFGESVDRYVESDVGFGSQLHPLLSHSMVLPWSESMEAARAANADSDGRWAYSPPSTSRAW